MADYGTAFNITMSKEGGYQANPADIGNYNSNNELVGTNWGISAPAYEWYYQTTPTIAHMKALTVNDAYEWAFNTIWNSNKLSQIDSQAIADQIFDILYNHSPSTAAKIIQEAIFNIGDPTGYVINTILPMNIQDRNAINMLTKIGKEVKLNNAIVEARVAYYNDRVKVRPDQMVFLKGWLTRANSFRMSTQFQKNMTWGIFITVFLGAAFYNRK